MYPGTCTDTCSTGTFPWGSRYSVRPVSQLYTVSGGPNAANGLTGGGYAWRTICANRAYWAAGDGAGIGGTGACIGGADTCIG